MNRVDLTGRQFGRLNVVAMKYESGRGKAECVCQCGVKLYVPSGRLKTGNTQSCGCLLRETRSALGTRFGSINGKLNATHGMSKSPTHIAWIEARKRCFEPKNQRYPYYGGRGITMCDEWATSFLAFFNYMGQRPDGMTLERIDVNGNYCPGNCKWATQADQMRNTRKTRLSIETVREARRMRADGLKLKEIAQRYGVDTSTIGLALRGKTWTNV